MNWINEARSIDAYAVLGVPETASKEDIKKQYRLLAGKFHPDRKQNSTKAVLDHNEEVMKRINRAWSILSVDEKRGEYDSARQQVNRDEIRQKHKDDERRRCREAAEKARRVAEEQERARVATAQTKAEADARSVRDVQAEQEPEEAEVVDDAPVAVQKKSGSSFFTYFMFVLIGCVVGFWIFSNVQNKPIEHAPKQAVASTVTKSAGVEKIETNTADSSQWLLSPSDLPPEVRSDMQKLVDRLDSSGSQNLVDQSNFEVNIYWSLEHWEGGVSGKPGIVKFLKVPLNSEAQGERLYDQSHSMFWCRVIKKSKWTLDKCVINIGINGSLFAAILANEEHPGDYFWFPNDTAEGRKISPRITSWGEKCRVPTQEYYGNHGLQMYMYDCLGSLFDRYHDVRVVASCWFSGSTDFNSAGKVDNIATTQYVHNVVATFARLQPDLLRFSDSKSENKPCKW